MIPHPPSPSPAPGPSPASEPFPMVRRRTPQMIGPGYRRRHRTARTAACDCRRQRKSPRLRTSVCRAYARDRTGIPSLESNISRFPVRFNAESRPKHRFFRRFRHFSGHVHICCTSFDADTRRTAPDNRCLPCQKQSCPACFMTSMPKGARSHENTRDGFEVHSG